MGKLKSEKVQLSPEMEAEKKIKQEAYYEKYLWKMARIGYRKYVQAEKNLIRDKIKKIDDEARRKIRREEAFSCLMKMILFSTYGYNNDMKQPVHSRNFNGLIMLSIIPETDGGKDFYYNNALGYLTLEVRNRLKIDPDKFTVFSDLMGGNRTSTGTPPNTNSMPGTWNYVYPLEKSKSSKNTELKKAKDKLIIDIDDALHEMYADIPDNSIIEADTTILNIKHKQTHEHDVLTPAEITALAYPVAIALGGGKVLILTNKAANSKRGSKLNRYASIEFSYILIHPITGVIPLTADKCPTILTVSDSHYILNLPESAKGLRIVIFARWVYLKHRDKSGGYGTSANTIVT